MIVTIERLKHGFDWLLPPLCLGCRASPTTGVDRFNLCVSCRREVRAIDGRRCRGCLEPICDPSAEPGFRCRRCRRRPPAYDHLLAGWVYEPPIEQMITGLKFQRLEYLADVFAEALLERFSADLTDADAVVAVPLHWRRSLGRGYNQARLMARVLADGLGRPLLSGLRRRRATAPQTGLQRRQRRTNVQGAFRWRGPEPLDSAHWLLVDDVCTTGATLSTAANVLKRAGVGRVTALVAALTPRPGQE